MLEWLGIEHEKRCVVAIDGKTICGSENEKHKAFHVVSAFVAENQLTLGEVTVPEKTNEIKAIPELLDLIDVEGGIVTLDAMGCQKKIVEKITKQKADYAIALKGNQEEFHSDVALYFSEFANSHPAHTTVEKGHGRVETREYRLCTDIGWHEKSDCWKGLKAIGNAVSRHTLTNRAVPIGTAPFMRNIPTTIPFLPNNYYFRHHQA